MIYHIIFPCSVHIKNTTLAHLSMASLSRPSALPGRLPPPSFSPLRASSCAVHPPSSQRYYRTLCQEALKMRYRHIYKGIYHHIIYKYTIHMLYIHTYIHTIPYHNITLHYITFHSIPLHYITLYYITLHYIHTYIHTYMYIYTHTYTCIYIYVCVYVYI